VAPEHVAIVRLQLTNFRNYPALQLDLHAPLVALTGPNGAGKTNLLEAISLLTPGRGLRRAAFDEITRHGAAAGWAVAATVRRGEADIRIGTGIAGAPGERESGRQVRINRAAAESSEALLDYLRVLWLTPAMDGLFAGPAGERRRFLDRLVLTVDPGHARRVRDLDRLLTQRNRLLEDGARAEWLAAIERQLAETAVAVALGRGETVRLLQARITAQAEADPAFPPSRIALSGAFDEALQCRSAASAELWYRDALAAGRAPDRAAGRTLTGPHRTDLHVTFAPKAIPAALCSTGEQKALLIGLILAHAELVAAIAGMAPILLLDEVAAHLDPGRRRALFARLAALGCQALMTGTDPELFAELPRGAATYRVVNNAAAPLTPPSAHADDANASRGEVSGV